MLNGAVFAFGYAAPQAASRHALWVLEGGFPGYAGQTGGWTCAPQDRAGVGWDGRGRPARPFRRTDAVAEGSGMQAGQTGPFFALGAADSG